MPPRLLAIGDIHGQADAFDTLLSHINPTPQDRIILLGDYVTGGPDSARVLDRVADLLARGNTVALRGNHDLVFEQAVASQERYDELSDGWPGLYRPETAASYRKIGVTPTRTGILARHGHLFHKFKNWHEEPDAIFVHARVDPMQSMQNQQIETLIWLKIDGPCQNHISQKPIICGHTRQRDGIPRDFGGAICIDTDAKGGGWLTCLDVNSKQCWQTMPDGRVREIEISKAEPQPKP